MTDQGKAAGVSGVVARGTSGATGDSGESVNDSVEAATNQAEAPKEVFAELVQTVAHLRQQCPWDKEQTHSSLRKHLLEEVYETLEAIDQISEAHAVGTAGETALASKNLCDELGDLLYQVFFHSLLAQERGEFDVSDVMSTINAKLIRRHPHVFGDLEVSSQEELAPHWEAIKKTETDRVSVMDGIPSALPALLYASKLQRKATSLGAKPPEETATLRDAMAAIRQSQAEQSSRHLEVPETEQEIGEVAVGQMLFQIVRLAAQQGIDCEAALRQEAHNFRGRYQELESTGADISSVASQSYIWEGKNL